MAKSESASKRPLRAGSYHHGDLRNALVRAAAELAEAGGPGAVTVRAAARAVGVTATAAYRHFAGHEDLLAAVKAQAQQTLFEAMASQMKSVPAQDDPVVYAIAQVYTVGRGYIEFAQRERGLFKTAFYLPEKAASQHHQAAAFGLLASALNALVDVGFMDPRHRPEAEVVAWSAVHGLASLIIDGALGDIDEVTRDHAVHRVLAAVLRSYATGPHAEPYRSTDPRVMGEPFNE
jgi:AcrR family transcriptional regulator